MTKSWEKLTADYISARPQQSVLTVGPKIFTIQEKQRKHFLVSSHFISGIAVLAVMIPGYPPLRNNEKFSDRSRGQGYQLPKKRIRAGSLPCQSSRPNSCPSLSITRILSLYAAQVSKDKYSRIISNLSHRCIGNMALASEYCMKSSIPSR